MSKLLLNLYTVSEDEAEDVRGFLAANAIEYYETRPSRWGISHGGIWVKHDADIHRAKRLMANYQQQRRVRIRAEHAQARQDGTAQTFADIWREQPLRVVMTLVAIACLLALVALPVWLLNR